jgi:site-specific DNA-methyltransferase (adenine-specific)
VLSVDRGGGSTRHPTEKPIELVSQLIESSSVRGDLVLDPFAGCGSTLVAAVLLGRRAIGIEIDERYASEAVRRLEYVEKLVTWMAAA